MEFGRFADIDRADTRLPPDPPETGALLRAHGTPAAAPRLRIGAARWGVPAWVGPLYPPGAPAGEFLRHYAERFTAVELNATYYQIPSEEALRGWCDQVPEGFRFCPKLPRHVSQRRRLTEELPAVVAFADRVRVLGERLGLCYLQLPPGFGPANITELRHFLVNVPEGLPLALEMRHPGWFRDPLARETFAFLAARGIATVITDTLGRRDAVHMRLTTPRAFIRFVGNDLHASDFTRIDDWVARVDTWIARGLEELYFFIHQPADTNTLVLASYLEQRLNDRLPGRGREA